MDPLLAGALIELGKEAFRLHTGHKLAEQDSAEALRQVTAATAVFKSRSSREAFEEGKIAGVAGDPVADPDAEGHEK